MKFQPHRNGVHLIGQGFHEVYTHPQFWGHMVRSIRGVVLLFLCLKFPNGNFTFKVLNIDTGQYVAMPHEVLKIDRPASLQKWITDLDMYHSDFYQAIIGPNRFKNDQGRLLSQQPPLFVVNDTLFISSMSSRDTKYAMKFDGSFNNAYVLDSMTGHIDSDGWDIGKPLRFLDGGRKTFVWNCWWEQFERVDNEHEYEIPGSNESQQ